MEKKRLTTEEVEGHRGPRRLGRQVAWVEVLVNGESLEVGVKVVTDRGLVGVSSIDGGG